MADAPEMSLNASFENQSLIIIFFNLNVCLNKSQGQ